MARRGKGAWRSGLSAALASFIAAVGLVAMPTSHDVPAQAAACNAGVVTKLHGDYAHTDAGFFAGYLGYAITDVATTTNLSIELALSGGPVSLATGQPGTQSYSNVTNADVTHTYFLVAMASTASDGDVTNIDVIVKDGATEKCRFTDTQTADGQYDTIAANSNKITSASIAGAGQTVGLGSKTVVTVAGETGTIGSGPSSRPYSQEIDLVPVSALGTFNPAAWELVRVEFRSDSASCNGGNSIVNRLHISSTSSPSSSGCGGTYKANYTFQARTSFSGTDSSEVQAFAYIASGTQIKHTSPYGTALVLPTVDSSSGNVSTVIEPNLASFSGTLYTVTFNANSADSGSVPASITSSGDIDLPGNTGSLVRSGYNFVGWATTNSATSALSNPYNLAADVTLYAVWVGNSFTVSFDGNGQNTGSAPTAVTGGGPITLPGNTGNLVKTGHRFLGWATTNSATSALPTSYNLTANTTLYAVWEQVFTITFDGNGNTGGTAPSDVVDVGAVTLPGNTGSLVKTNNTFLGWATTNNATSAMSSSYTLSADVTLYAVWSPSYTVTFDGNGATTGSVPSPVTSAGTITLPGNTGALAISGYVFLGWATTSGATTALPTSYTITGNVTLYAVWQQQFTITFDANGATSGSVPSQVTGNGSVTLPSNTGTLAISGYTFLGWAATNSATSALSSSYNLTADVTLYAVWQVTPTPAPPAATNSDPCEPVSVASSSAEYVELGLIGVLSELWAASLDALTVSTQKLFAAAMGSEFVAAVADNQVAMVNLDIDPDTYLGIISDSAVYKTLAKGSPRQTTAADEIEPSDVVVSPGTEPNSVEITSASGQPLELLSVQSIDLNLYAAFTGAELNNPKVWQDLGYGLMCWKLEPFSDTWFYLPESAQPPGAPAGNWTYSNIIVKAGSITADPTTFQANTLFPSAKGGEMVWADVNGNGVYDPGGRTGDKAISHIVLCADLVTASTPTPSEPEPTTEPPTSSPTPTVTVTPTTPAPTATSTPTTPVPTVTVTPTSPTPTATATPTTPVPTTPEPTTSTPVPTESPEPTTTPCSTPTVAPPSAPPSPQILILWSPTPTPPSTGTPAPTPTEPTSSPEPTTTPSVTPSPSDTTTTSPTPTDPTSPSAEPTPSTSPTAPTTSPEPTDSPSATPSPSESPSDGPTPGPTATPSGPVPPPVFDPEPPTTCEPSDEFGVSMKLTNGITTSCYRMTTQSFINIAAFGGFGFLETDDEIESNESELADTGFETTHWLVVALLMLSIGSALVVYARRRV